MALKDERGFWKDGKGNLIHPDNVKAIDKIKDEFVEELILEVAKKEAELKSFKAMIVNKIDDYYALLGQEYDIAKKINKGNATLENFSKTAKVQIAMSENLEFDEKIAFAKVKIDEFLNDITKTSSSDIRTLITKAFEVDKKGNMDVKRILALRTYDIKDVRWQEAMNIIDESKSIVSIKGYIRFYERENQEDKYEPISLDFANV